jgi:hypothetical protein
LSLVSFSFKASVEEAIDGGLVVYSPTQSAERAEKKVLIPPGFPQRQVRRGPDAERLIARGELNAIPSAADMHPLYAPRQSLF